MVQWVRFCIPNVCLCLCLCVLFSFSTRMKRGPVWSQYQIRLYRWTVLFSIISFEKFSIWLRNGCCAKQNQQTAHTNTHTSKWKKKIMARLLLKIGIIEDKTTLMSERERSEKNCSVLIIKATRSCLWLTTTNQLSNFLSTFMITTWKLGTSFTRSDSMSSDYTRAPLFIISMWNHFRTEHLRQLLFRYRL